ncbi:DedA family protein [Halobacteriales archaeon QS_1_67_19]|nr:MAG: DedA family protein [Halobacteriales archaeon QS_1_67_19]
MLEWLVDVVLAFVGKYGYAAVFVYMVLETAFILHFAPSEIVIPFAAHHLVTDRASFVSFLGVTTVGATLGALLAYYVFGVYGEKALERFGHVLHVEESDIDRGRTWFRKWGENSVFWCRLLPVMRAVISIPAGMAGMGLRKFVAYSAVGSAIFNVGFTWLVYSGADAHSPLDIALLRAGDAATSLFRSPELTVLVGCLSIGAGWLAWDRREQLRARFDY